MSPRRPFDGALLGRPGWLELSSGQRIALPVDRWTCAAGDGDRWLLDRCRGPTLDLGCGPGRLLAALAARGVPALGIDHSRVAMRLTEQRGGVALHRDVFGRLPGEGRWRHVLLADGNVGIGGDPVRMLARARELICSDGSVLTELDPPGTGLWRGRARVRGDGGWFGWGRLGADAVDRAARPAGLRVRALALHRGRWFARLGHG